MEVFYLYTLNLSVFLINIFQALLRILIFADQGSITTVYACNAFAFEAPLGIDICSLNVTLLFITNRRT